VARSDVETDELWERFHVAVNMPSPELRNFLAASEETLTDYREEPDVDLPALGREVLAVLGKRRTDVTEDDQDVMRLVADIVEARLENRPANGVRNDEWRHGLMMLGHDPVREAGERDAVPLERRGRGRGRHPLP
jgi:hypothetical protein